MHTIAKLEAISMGSENCLSCCDVVWFKFFPALNHHTFLWRTSGLLTVEDSWSTVFFKPRTATNNMNLQHIFAYPICCIFYSLYYSIMTHLFYNYLHNIIILHFVQTRRKPTPTSYSILLLLLLACLFHHHCCLSSYSTVEFTGDDMVLVAELTTVEEDTLGGGEEGIPCSSRLMIVGCSHSWRSQYSLRQSEEYIQKHTDKHDAN